MIKPPLSQKPDTSPIGFALVDVTRPGIHVQLLTLNIRPEEITITTPSRVTVQQTLGQSGESGAWIDEWGEGLVSINISGHTGWRTDAAQKSAVERLIALQGMINQWHSMRALAASEGRNPDGIKLAYSDGLNFVHMYVAPLNFMLKRSRSRPLLMMYQIAMIGTGYISAAASLALDHMLAPKPTDQSVGDSLASAMATMDKITASLNHATGILNTALPQLLAGPMNSFNSLTAAIVGTVNATRQAPSASLNLLAADLCQGASNVWRVLAASISDPFASLLCGQAASAYETVLCLLKNVLIPPSQFPDFSAVYGSSNCSSTTGGSPVSQLANPLAAVYPNQVAPATQNDTAQFSTGALKNCDPVLAPPSVAALQGHLSNVANGTTINTDAVAAIASTSAVPATSTSTAGMKSPLTGIRYAQTQWGDTLQSIALRELGDASKWVDIVNINGLKAPYLTGVDADVSSTVLKYGASLKVPSTFNSTNGAESASAIYGTDIDLTDGDFSATESGDIAVLSGVPNLKQALTMRVNVQRYELLYHPDYGSMVRSVLGKGNNTVEASLANGYAQSSVLSDQRVQRIQKANTQVTGDSMEITMEVNPIVGKPISIFVSL